jgi:hypothetical protein
MAQCLSFYSFCPSLGVNCYLYSDIKRTTPVSAGWVSDGTTNWTINSSGMITSQAACVVPPYLACYALEITYGFANSACFGNDQDTFESWRIILLDQFGNLFTTSTNLTFDIEYYFTSVDDVSPYNIAEYVNSNITVNAGNYEGIGYFLTNSTFPCSMSGDCFYSCYSTISQINIVGVPDNIPGGCSAPPPAPFIPFILFAPNVITPNGDGINDTFKIYTLLNGVTEELNYAAYPNATWDFYDSEGFYWYRNTVGGVYVPWNNRYDNSPTGTFNTGTMFYKFNLNDGSGRKLQGFVTPYFPELYD